MKFLTIQIGISLLIFSFTSSVFAEKSNEIYKWTDKDGRVHYAASPGDKSAQKMNVASKRFVKKEKADNNKTEQETEERAKFCQDAKKTQKKYKSAPFLYRHDEERDQKVRLTEQETKDAFLQVEKDISYWCFEQKQQDDATQDEDEGVDNNKDNDENQNEDKNQVKND